MTLIVGYIHDNETHIFCDSAITSIYPNSHEKPEPVNTETSFLETSIAENNVTIDETGYKLYSFENRVLMTFSGNEFIGKNVLKDLVILFSGDYHEKIQNILEAYFENEKPNASFIIAFPKGNISGLFAFSPCSGNQISFHNSAFIAYGSGSKRSEIMSSLKVAIKGFVEEHQPSSEELNVGIQSILQSITQNYLSFHSGVGGFFNGAYIREKTVIWGADTIYLLCSSKEFEKYNVSLIFKYNYKNSIFISALRGNTIYLPDSFWEPDIKTRIDTNARDFLLDKRKKNSTKYFSVISFDRLLALVVTKQNNSDVAPIKLKSIEEGKINIQLSSQVITFIRQTPKNPVTNKPDDSGRIVRLNIIRPTE